MLGFILGPILEENFRRAMLLSHGSFATFIEHPISGSIFGIVALIFAWQIVSGLLARRRADKSSSDEPRGTAPSAPTARTYQA
jgi:TctA family transporter